ncbi:Carbohydrate-binding module family 67 protein [Mycena venus]|uniref:Carbohydrate-binding module family 67 protein n=1 Tax=Mycena venus TaxID=2733690 RepID=A0A8H6TYJ5_9AGAR|nr:Carbohydrate-binding module family 67 protein [Mycena venus]
MVFSSVPGNNFQVAQKYTVTLSPAPSVVFAVYAVNTLTVNNPAGLLAAIEINSSGECNCTSGSYLITDGSWKSNTGTPIGFQLPGFDDSSWPAATTEGAYGVAPWNTVTVTPVSGPVECNSECNCRRPSQHCYCGLIYSLQSVEITSKPLLSFSQIGVVVYILRV